MTYRNGKEVLPEHILAEVQEYYSGGLLYIPAQEKARCKWGTRTATKAELEKRNQEICYRKIQGSSIQELMEEYHLAYDTIKRIIYRWYKEGLLRRSSSPLCIVWINKFLTQKR